MKNNGTFKMFMSYVLLNMLGMLGISCYILADTYFIANGIGAGALTALNLALPIFGLVNGIGLLLGIGSGTRYTLLLSKNKAREANQIFSQTLLIGLMMGALISVSGIVGSKTICMWLGADTTTFDMMNAYLKIILGLAPFFILNYILIAFVRNDGEPKLTMMAMIFGSLVNIILDYWFVYPLGMGMFGAALATGIAPMISMSILSVHFFKKNSRLRLVKSKPQLRTLTDSLGLGISAFVTELSTGIVLLVFNLVILELAGNVAVAAYGIIANISLVCLALFTGIAQGVQPLISRYYGAGDMKKVYQALRYALGLAVGLGIVLYVGIYGFANPLIAVFNKEQDVLLAQLALSGMHIYFIGIIFAGINIVGAAYLSATEKGKKGFSISMLRGLVLIIPSVMGLAMTIGLNGVWMSFVGTEFVTACFTLTIIYQDYKKKN
ncbi:MAG: MATE family efflux transporter [Cellulosilyticaceae bacterium]